MLFLEASSQTFVILSTASPRAQPKDPANGSGLQKETLRNILLAWVLTLPVCVLLGAGLFASALVIIFNVLGLH